MKKILWCSVLFALFAVGLLLTWADEQAISPLGVAYFYNPMWACGDAPPFFVVDISVNREQYKGTAMRCFRHGVDMDADGQPGAGLGSSLLCEGQIKRSLSLFLRERFLMEGTAATGIFFDATNCTATTPTVEQKLYIDRMLYSDETLVP